MTRFLPGPVPAASGPPAFCSVRPDCSPIAGPARLPTPTNGANSILIRPGGQDRDHRLRHPHHAQRRLRRHARGIPGQGADPAVQRGGAAHRHRLSRRAARGAWRHAAGGARVRRQHEGVGGSPGAARRDARAGGGPAVHPAAVLRLVDLHDRAGAGVGHRAVVQPVQPALDGALRRPHHRRGPGATPGRARGHPRDGMGAEGGVLRGGAGQGLPGSGTIPTARAWAATRSCGPSSPGRRRWRCPSSSTTSSTATVSATCPTSRRTASTCSRPRRGR